MRAFAADLNELDTVGELSLTTPLLVFLAVCLLLAAVLAAAAVMLSRPRRTAAKPARGAHAHASDKTRWRARIDGVTRAYHDGELSREEAFVALARIAREFASLSSGRNLGASTLTDLASQRSGATRGGLQLLRQTIEALYPPEFADAAVNSHARGVEVDEAAGWVSNLVERWRR
ncbi:hypothetical protein BLEM_0843 [Bifidobacterium lemurum]|uniref:Uncharacterized protein n=1 Tax=Bifidobacterium lemurum TaxID=1603886 RepID=A0A261FT18_9BIFI|nr:hypothetical protein [Bifidobacterium lemurum]OZG62297.1 hypothetical protein BLEM_0843 [Bifidobacterium lemurum]QOL33663.1 hypothetical protein BL8807_07645 [Bifidobacterium lemurum]